MIGDKVITDYSTNKTICGIEYDDENLIKRVKEKFGWLNINESFWIPKREIKIYTDTIDYIVCKSNSERSTLYEEKYKGGSAQEKNSRNQSCSKIKKGSY